MKINDILHPGAAQPSRGITARPTPPVTRQDVEADAGVTADRAEFNREAKVEAQILDAAKLVYEALPDIRADLLSLARQRLADGFYDRPVVMEQIARGLAADPEAQPTPPLSLEQQAEVKRRLAEGFYDRPEAVGRIARGLAEDAEG